jgi:uncharacterized protein YciW
MIMLARKPKPDNKPSFENFLEAAKAAETRESDERLAAIVRHVARTGSAASTKPKPSSK